VDQLVVLGMAALVELLQYLDRLYFMQVAAAEAAIIIQAKTSAAMAAVVEVAKLEMLRMQEL
jgi:hypothetical protein